MSDQTAPESPAVKVPNQAKVAAVVDFVRDNPGCTKKAASAAVAPHASYGYRFVQAAIDQGLIRAERSPNVVGRPYTLTVVPD